MPSKSYIRLFRSSTVVVASTPTVKTLPVKVAISMSKATLLLITTGILTNLTSFEVGSTTF